MKLLLLIFIYMDDLNLCVFLYTFDGVNVFNYLSIYGYRFCYIKIISKIYLNISLKILKILIFIFLKIYPIYFYCRIL